MGGGTETGPEGLWEACLQMETSATAVVGEQLSEFASPATKCYEAAVQAPTLPAKRHREPDMRMAALFLKKSLNDLRAVWVLLRLGYTSQAASVAASLYENSLAATCLAGSTENADILRKSRSGDLPWKPLQLAKMAAGRWMEEPRHEGTPFNQADFERMWQETYAAYKWLCKIKHPTVRSALHDAFSTPVASDEYVVMAAPDLRPEDLPVKAAILTIALSRVETAVRSFAQALDCDKTTPAYHEFSTRLEEMVQEAEAAYKAIKRPLPFDIGDTPLARDWAKNKRIDGSA